MIRPDTTTGTLHDGEPHPAAHDAKAWILEYVGRNPPEELPRLLEAFCSTGMSGNRLAECCGETLRRLLHGEPVSDRYLLALAWTMRNMEREREPAEITSQPADRIERVARVLAGEEADDMNGDWRGWHQHRTKAREIVAALPPEPVEVGEEDLRATLRSALIDVIGMPPILSVDNTVAALRAAGMRIVKGGS